VAAQAKVGWGYTDIVRELRRVNYDFFQHLTPQTVNGWIEKVGGFSQWKASVLARAAKGNIPGHNKGGRRGILVKKVIFLFRTTTEKENADCSPGGR
jgi:hypothetical protein